MPEEEGAGVELVEEEGLGGTMGLVGEGMSCETVRTLLQDGQTQSVSACGE